MPFSSGTFSRVHDWTSDRDAGIKISASRTDAEFDGIATALTSTMLKDGSQTLTAMIPFTLGLSVPTDKKLQLRDSAIFLNSSADGQADLVADSVIQVTAPTVNIEASTAITLESDAITLGENGDTDIVLTFNANSADGVITWKEDEDYFLLSDDILMNSTEKIQFGDTASFIQQSSDGVLRIDGEATIDLNASTAVLVSHDLKLDSDGAILGFGADNDVTLTHVHDTGLLLNTNLNVTRSDNGDNLTLISTDADAGGGPALSFYRNSSSPADDDTMCTIRFEGNNDNSQLVIYGKIRADIADASDGTEDGTIHIFNMMAGTERAMLSIKPTEVVFNEESQDVDFRVEGDTFNHLFMVDASSDCLGVGIATPTFATGRGVHLADDFYLGFGNGNGTRPDFQLGYTSSDTRLDLRCGFGSDTADIIITSSGFVGLGGTLGTARFFVTHDATGTQTAVFKNSNSSVATEVQNTFATRAGNSAYSLIKAHSNDNGDVEFNFRGDGNAFADGSFSGGGADYAEFFEWKDGNSSSEDRVGYSVILDENKIVKASNTDDTSKIIGVISGSPAVIGDGDVERWKQKYLRDDYGREVWEEYTVTEWTENGKEVWYETDKIPEDVTVPSDKKVITTEVDGVTKLKRRKLNPSWDKSKTYISREDRKEWGMVGLMGKLRLRKGQPTGDRWIKMRDISDTVEEWLVR
jgi:hypothetical protein